MLDIFKLFQKAFVRLRTAAMNPFRRIVRRIQQVFNINLITAKLIAPINKKIRSILNVKPKSREDYITVGIFWISKKLIYFLILAACAGVFIYFSWFAKPIDDTVTANNVMTTVYYDYDDLKLAEYSGKANIRAANREVVYTGDVVSGVCTGVGTLWNQDGVLIYEGAFENNKFSGAGTLYYPGRKVRYEGNFTNNVYAGTGTSYFQDGSIEYEGEFENGMFSGEGTLYREDGTVSYAGNFVNGNFSGAGISYFENGVKKYEGEFYLGKAQGMGTSYSSTGKKLFTGQFVRDQIQYESLLNVSMEDVLAMCNELPKVYYAKGATCFLFEGLGIALETNCIVEMKKDEADTNSGNGWYLPGEEDSELLQETEDDTVAVEFPDQLNPDVNVNININGDSQNNSSGTEGDAGGNTGTGGDSGTEGGTDTGDSGETDTGGGGSTNAGDSAGTGAGTGEAGVDAQTDQGDKNTVELPVINNAGKYNAYYYLDTDEWQKEADLDYSQIQVKGLAILNKGFSVEFLKDKTCTYNNGEADLLECVAIDRLRLEKPTLFSNITFTQTAKTKKYILLSGIDLAAAIYTESYEVDKVRYRLCYEKDNYEQWQFITLETY